MNKMPKSMRLHIGIFGKRNVGKSSLINVLTNQNTSIVSPVAGTTTDAVEKTMEMLPLGPIVLIDTAGIDDVGELGAKRVEKSEKIANRTDIAIIVCDYNGWSNYEIELAENFKERNIEIIAVVNKTDIKRISENSLAQIKKYAKIHLEISALTDSNTASKIREALIRSVPEEFINPPSILQGLVQKEDVVILVTPIDKEAPKGRLILPQVNVLRELLDNSCISVVTTEKTLKTTLNSLKKPPKIVITDSQAFKEVAEIVPENIALTSFSILFAGIKGDLKEFFKGAKAIDNLKDGDKVLICESCSHHPIEDDIGRVKIPRLIKNKVEKNIYFENVASHEFPKNLNEYSMIIHCGGCMTNRREILSRISKSQEAKIPITNYGMAISYSLGILNRAMKPFEKML